MKTFTTKIKHKNEEGDCEACAFPIYVGDKAVTNQHDDLYCSKACASKHEGE